MPKLFIDTRYVDVPTPGEWLGSLLKSKDVSQAQIGRILALNKGQLSRMLSDDEAIPSRIVDIICDHFGVEDRTAVHELVSIKRNVEELWTLGDKRLKPVFGKDWELIVRRLLSSVEACVTRMQPATQSQRIHFISLFLAHAHHAARSVLRAAKGGDDIGSGEGEGLLFTKHDAVTHLRFPMNVLVGDLLGVFKCRPDSEPMRNVMDSLRYIAEGPPKKKAPTGCQI